MKDNFTPATVKAKTPSGVLKLYCTPLSPSYSDSMIFKTAAKQSEWHTSQYNATASALTFNNMRPFRAGEEIIVNGDYEKIQKNNYFSYSGDSVIWYGFINAVTYISENACKITYSIDVIQSFMFDAIIDSNGKSKIPECFVERETVASDKYFEHIVEEGIGTQTQVVKQRDNLFAYLNTPNFEGLDQKDPRYAKIYLLCGKAKFPNGDPTFHALDSKEYNGYNNNAYYYATTPAEELWATLNGLPLSSYNYPLENLVTIFPIPTKMIEYVSEYFETFTVKDPTTPTIYKLTIPAYTNYTPKNNKLYTKEFCKVRIVNVQNGETEISTNSLLHGTTSLSRNINCYLNIANGGGMILTTSTIENWVYQTTASNTGDIFILSNSIPSIDIISDAYNEWKRTRQESLNASLTASAMRYGMTAVGSVAGAAVGDLSGIGSLVSSTVGIVNSFNQAKIEENIAKNAPDNIITSTSSITDIYNLSYPVIIYSQPSVDEVKKIDSYFNAYGYKINEIKTPTLFNRKKWDFIKTTNCRTIGTCSHLYLDKINQIFNSGIRLHHDSFNTVVDCTVTNATA